MVRKKTRKNYFKNSAAKRKARRTQYLLGTVKIVSGLLLVAAMSFAFIFSYDLFTQSNFFSTRDISVEGCERLKHQEVIDQAGYEIRLPAEAAQRRQHAPVDHRSIAAGGKSRMGEYL